MKRLTYSVAEAAHSIGISRTKLYELIASGEIDTITIGRRRLLPVAAVERFLAGPEHAA